MTTSPKISVFKDVVAYVDVWSSDKTANYSKPFIQQLQEMGAQVSKTFNKQVTHVVFNNGHPATWRKAKKSDVKLVSVLWIGRCFEDGVHVDEDLYPALNDESNPVLKNKKHRCMQPKDSPERTPENDKRLRKRLDKMMKVLAPKQPLATDVSPIIIDEESGIVYSPALKRSDYMAQRLKDMKEKRENLSPTASQMVDSSPTGLKPSLGSAPAVFKLIFDQSDDDSSSAAEPACSPDKEDGRTQVDVTDHGHLKRRHRKISDKPSLSPCREVPKMISSPLKCPNFEDSEGNQQKKLKRTSARKKLPEEHSPNALLKSPCPDIKPDTSSNLCKEKSRSQIKSYCSSPKKPEKVKQKVNADKTVKETKTSICPDDVNSSCLASPTISGDAAFEKETTTPLKKLEQKVFKHSRSSLSALVRSKLSGEPCSVAPGSADSDDNVFEDYFSPANNNQRSKKSLLSNMPPATDIYIPFELDPVPKKRKVRSDSVGSETKKKRKLEESQHGKNRQLDESSQTQQDSKDSQPATDISRPSETLMAKKRRQSTLPFTSTNDALKRRRASLQSTVLTEDNAVPKLARRSNVRVHSHSLENVGRGNECTVATAVTKILSEGERTSNKQINLNLQKMISKTKAARTLVMTSMPTEKQHTVIQVVKALGGFLITDQVCESTTHVVSGGHRRTLNILLGIAHGCWILSFEWILWCLEQRQWIPEEPYELSDQFPAAQISRLQRHLSAGEHQQDLFQGQPAMFVSQHSQPPTQSLVELIQLCGGTVCKTMRQAGICIGRYSGRRPEGSRVLSEQWVLDSITHLKQLSYDNYELE